MGKSHIDVVSRGFMDSEKVMEEGSSVKKELVGISARVGEEYANKWEGREKGIVQ